jgi:hypothetical protein
MKGKKNKGEMYKEHWASLKIKVEQFINWAFEMYWQDEQFYQVHITGYKISFPNVKIDLFELSFNHLSEKTNNIFNEDSVQSTTKINLEFISFSWRVYWNFD